MTNRRHLSELERTIRSIILQTLNPKITDRGLVPETSIERMDKGIKELLECFCEILEQEKKKSTPIKKSRYNTTTGYIRTYRNVWGVM